MTAQQLGTILAIDPSGKGTGIAEGVPGGTPQLLTLRFHTDELDRPVEVFGRAASWLMYRFDRQPLPAVMAIEHPLVVHNPMIVCGLYALFTGMARAHGVRVLPVTIAEWRKFFLGRGKLDGPTAKREAMRICQALKWEAKDHNAAESAGIWLYACSLIAPKGVQRVEPLFTGAQES